MFFGSIPALVTPFAAGRVDEAAFRVLSTGRSTREVTALVPCGTTGEARDADRDEHRRVIEIAVEVGARAGAGHRRLRSRTTPRHAIALTKARQGGRRRRRAARAALLQPAEPGRDLRRISRPSPTLGHPDRPLQCARRGRSPTSRSRRWPAVAAAQCRRGQGRDRQSGAGLGAAPRLRRGVHPAVAAMTTWRWASTRWAGWAASRSPPTSRRGCAPTSRRRCAKGAGTRRSRSRTGSTRSTPRCSADASPGPVKYALSKVRPGFPTELRLPMTEPSAAAKAAVDAALAHAGLGECSSGVVALRL